MSRLSISSRWLVALGLTVVSCSQGDAGRPTAPSVASSTEAGGSSGAASLADYPANDVGILVASTGFSPAVGEVGGSAAGDVQNGPIEILRVRVHQEGLNGFYAEPGGMYRVNPLSPVEFWVEWTSPSALANPPRLAIDWSFSESDNVGCGPCLIRKSFPEGRHQVRIRMDDRVGGVTTRTFTIESAFLPSDSTCSELAASTVVSASLNAAGPLQNGRIFRDGIPSACPSKVYPGPFGVGTNFAYRVHSFTLPNAGATCLTVNFDPNTGGTPCGTNAHASAYVGGYNPSSQATGYVGDVGSSLTQPFAFTVPAGAQFQIVVTNTSVVATCTYAFSFSTAACQ